MRIILAEWPCIIIIPFYRGLWSWLWPRPFYINVLYNSAQPKTPSLSLYIYLKPPNILHCWPFKVFVSLLLLVDIINGFSTCWTCQLHLRRYLFECFQFFFFKRAMKVIGILFCRLWTGEYPKAWWCDTVSWVWISYSLQEEDSQKYLFFFLCFCYPFNLMFFFFLSFICCLMFAWFWYLE